MTGWLSSPLPIKHRLNQINLHAKALLARHILIPHAELEGVDIVILDEFHERFSSVTPNINGQSIPLMALLTLRGIDENE